MHTLTEDEKKSLESIGYNIIDMLSEGSYSLVYVGEYVNKGKDGQPPRPPKDIPLKVALKVIDLGSMPIDVVEKFLVREMTIHSRISHPHIIHLHSILQINSRVILVTRFAERGNLFDHLVHYGPVWEKQARLWFRQLAVALSYLHSMFIAHRSIKCENILITASNNVKLCDFGFARHCIDSNRRQVYSVTYCGTLDYASPELIKGIPYDPMVADVWSLGVVLYAMLNGTLPFRTKDFTSLVSMHISNDYRFRTEVLMRVSKEAVLLVERMLEPNWNKRATVDELLHSPWMAMEPKLLELTDIERAALMSTDHFNMKKKLRVNKEVMLGSEN